VSTPADGTVAALTSGGGGAGGSARVGDRKGVTAPAGAKQPIVLGYVGALSGLAGPSGRPVADVFVAWSKAVNAKGGINGHPVHLLIGDDAGNAARSISIAQDFVENKGAIALTYMSADTVSFANWAQKKGIPIIGGAAGDPVWNSNPYMFPPATGVDGGAWGQARIWKAAGLTKVGVVYCAESPICKGSADRVASYAAEEGLQVVYSGQMSIAQPDYTAECLQVRNSGAQAISLATTNDSASRLATSCSRQGVRPAWTTAAADDAMAKQPEFDNAIGALNHFPWFVHGGSPALDEYVDALKKYAPSRLTDGNSLQTAAWIAGKLIEAAAAKVSDKPTTQDILDGLWSMHGETLGGLDPGPLARTFIRNQPTPDAYCVFLGRVRGGRWVATQGMTPLCR
jgi:branched-chain amino acid transport system substrate-binding protein